MPKMLESLHQSTADEIAEFADDRKDISRFFSRKGKMVTPSLSAKKEEGYEHEG